MARDELQMSARTPPPEPTGSLAAGLLRAARPKQWIKNVLVFAAPGAAGVLDQGGPLVDTLVAFACFCLAAAGTYYLNDAADVDADRVHPTKRFRPIASGVVPIGLARVLGPLLITAWLALGFAARWELAVTIAAYVTMTTTYTVWLKHIPVVDLVAIASGFVLRAIAGATATGVPISDWFFIVASFGSLFMVVGKRHAEALEMGESAVDVRSTLGQYTPAYLAYLRSVSSGAVLIAYCLWAFEKAGPATSPVPWFQISILPFVLGILRYAFLVDAGKGGAPEELVLRDRSLQAVGLAWAVLFGIGIYAG
ncbi:decaprenyl-phosphate phosphoribosyltransferase [soil metagenome]